VAPQTSQPDEKLKAIRGLRRKIARAMQGGKLVGGTSLSRDTGRGADTPLPPDSGPSPDVEGPLVPAVPRSACPTVSSPEPRPFACRARLVKPAVAQVRTAGPQAIVYRRGVPMLEPVRVPEGGGICIPLERCVEGRETRGSDGLPFYLVERPVPEAAALYEAVVRTLELLARRQAPDTPPPFALSPEDVTFLDLETTGLNCSPVFLIGTLVCHGRELVARQLLARTYAEEAAIIAHFADQSAHRPLVVSFNGKSFDVPYLRTRAIATGVRFHEPGHHLDLLHEARRVCKGRLPDCRLQTLERHLCGRHRDDDIPSHDIPRAYHDFVRTGDARQLAQIVEHNLHDLVTMVHLLSKVIRDA
jgi:uncharacterized protein YprB with RNaseH-like and TPR domain